MLAVRRRPATRFATSRRNDADDARHPGRAADPGRDPGAGARLFRLQLRRPRRGGRHPQGEHPPSLSAPRSISAPPWWRPTRARYDAALAEILRARAGRIPAGSRPMAGSISAASSRGSAACARLWPSRATPCPSACAPTSRAFFETPLAWLETVLRAGLADGSVQRGPGTGRARPLRHRDAGGGAADGAPVREPGGVCGDAGGAGGRSQAAVNRASRPPAARRPGRCRSRSPRRAARRARRDSRCGCPRR